MTKFMIIVFAIACFSPQVFGLWDLVKELIKNDDSEVTRVRTNKEMAERSKENVVLDFIGLVEQYEGYTAEEYEVKTRDGYILKLHRVNGSPLSPAADGKPVVYIGHGLFGSSDFFAALGPRQALLYTLADAGYDIWIGNFRGNGYSKRHVKQSPKGNNLDFWGFSMDEVALIDLPLFIDTVLQKTNQKKLSYIGYSMGNTLSAMLLSAKPEYNDKMHVVISIAPVVLFSLPLSPLAKTLRALATPGRALALTGRVYQLLPQSKLLSLIGKDVCASRFGRIFCEKFLNNVAHVDRMNATVIPNVLKYCPAGASLFMVDQYVQFVKNGKVTRYDYGILKPFVHQDSSIPSEYDLTKVTSPQAFFYSDGDVYSNVRDVIKLNSTFPNVVALESIPNYNHLDYMWLDEDKKTVYKRLLEIIHEHSNE